MQARLSWPPRCRPQKEVKNDLSHAADSAALVTRFRKQNRAQVNPV
jgi:hypothetical protein